MAEKNKKGGLFVLVVALCYAIVIAATYARVYVLHAYPIYHNEDQIPSLGSEFYTVFDEL
jgi:hypothetical protein